MRKIFALLVTLCSLATMARAGEVEVLHYWTSGGEAAALDVLKRQMADDGHLWQDFVIAGGGGANAMAELQSRVLKAMPPTAAQIKGLDIQRWARLGFLANLNDIAQADEWDKKLPEVVANAMKHKDKYVAVPVNVHRTNWLWVNKPLLDSLNLSVPQTWDEFDRAAAVIQQAGYQVIAQGNQAWQHATLFEVVALSIGGPDYYRRAFVRHEFSAMKSTTTEAVFKRYYSLLAWMDLNTVDLEWSQATQEVIDGRAAFQFMGDWAKGEFIKAGKVANRDYMCVAVPGTAKQFIFNIDSFAIFNLRDNNSANLEAQRDLVKNVMSKSFQRTFNLNKGSIPARTDLSAEGFDLCAKYSMSEFLIANEQQALLPSIAHGMATSGTIRSYFYEQINALTAKPLSPKESSAALAKAIRYGQYILK